LAPPARPDITPEITADVTPEDATPLDRLRAGDMAAFDAIFREHYPRLVGAVTTMLGDRDAAEEVAQEVMFELWRRRAELVIEGGLRPYLHRSARNRALNRIRHERTVQSAQPLLAAGIDGPASADSASSADNLVRAREIDAALVRAREAMPPRCREVFELSRLHGLRYAEIAAALEISVKTVEVQMGKALRIVREHLDPWLRDNG
jgi:RNA polymerase sigma-70 factor (ECF subfamily)